MEELYYLVFDEIYMVKRYHNVTEIDKVIDTYTDINEAFDDAEFLNDEL